MEDKSPHSMNFISAILVLPIWMFSFVLIAVLALTGASHSPNDEAVKWVAITLLINAIGYVLLLNAYMNLKALCDKFIE